MLAVISFCFVSPRGSLVFISFENGSGLFWEGEKLPAWWHGSLQHGFFFFCSISPSVHIMRLDSHVVHHWLTHRIGQIKDQKSAESDLPPIDPPILNQNRKWSLFFFFFSINGSEVKNFSWLTCSGNEMTPPPQVVGVSNPDHIGGGNRAWSNEILLTFGQKNRSCATQHDGAGRFAVHYCP